MGGVSTTEILADLIAFPTVSRDSNRALIDYCSTMLGKVGVRARSSKVKMAAKPIFLLRLADPISQA